MVRALDPFEIAILILEGVALPAFQDDGRRRSFSGLLFFVARITCVATAPGGSRFFFRPHRAVAWALCALLIAKAAGAEPAPPDPPAPPKGLRVFVCKHGFHVFIDKVLVLSTNASPTDEKARKLNRLAPGTGVGDGPVQSDERREGGEPRGSRRAQAVSPDLLFSKL
jgi:hypothetical protein